MRRNGRLPVSDIGPHTTFSSLNDQGAVNGGLASRPAPETTPFTYQSHRIHFIVTSKRDYFGAPTPRLAVLLG